MREVRIMSEYAIVLITTPDEEMAAKIAKSLVKNQLAACVSIIPQVRSIYRWEGEICDDNEVQLIVKTVTEVFDQVQRVVKDIHSYDIPEIMLLPIENGSEDYLQWIDNCVSI